MIAALFLVTFMALLARVNAFSVIVTWLVVSAIAIGTWHRFEGFVLREADCRPLSGPERRALGTAVDGLSADLLMLDHGAAWHVRGLRSIVIGSGMLELMDDRQLRALLRHASCMDPTATASELVVWLGVLPLLAAWHANRWIVRVGEILALLVGAALVLPLLIWPRGFTHWGGRLFGAMLGGILSSLLIASGLVLPGLALGTAWAVVPALRGLLAWETRRMVRAADAAVLDAGLGWDLLSAMEQLLWLDPQPVPPGLVGLLWRVGEPIRARLDRLWRALSQSPEP